MKGFSRTRRSLLAVAMPAWAIGAARAARADEEARVAHTNDGTRVAHANEGTRVADANDRARAGQAEVVMHAFVPGSFDAILASAVGAPLIVHLWGLTCAPCIVELPRWAAFVRRHPQVNVVFVQTDPMPLDRVAAALRRAGLVGAQHWSAPAPLDEGARYRVDADWAGELPRTLLIGAHGQRSGVSGTVAFERVRAWLVRQGVRETPRSASTLP